MRMHNFSLSCGAGERRDQGSRSTHPDGGGGHNVCIEHVQRMCTPLDSAARIDARARLFCVGSLLGKHGILSFDLRLAANPFRSLSTPLPHTLSKAYVGPRLQLVFV